MDYENILHQDYKNILHQYESLIADITVPISALNIVLEWPLSKNITPYGDLMILAINELDRLSVEHSSYINEMYKQMGDYSEV